MTSTYFEGQEEKNAQAQRGYSRNHRPDCRQVNITVVQDRSLKARDKSDYQVAVLQVAGTDATTDEIIGMEERWKEKVQSKEMGLGR